MIRLLLAMAAVLLMPGCESTSPPGGPTTTHQAHGNPSGPVIDVKIAGGTVTPTNAEFKATVGQPIELRVDSDATDELHVHAVPEQTFDVKAEPNQTFTFTVDVPGRVEVELHELGGTVAIIEVRQ